MEKSSNTITLNEQIFSNLYNDTDKIVVSKSQYPLALLEYALTDPSFYDNLLSITKNEHKFTINSASPLEEDEHEYEKIPFLEAIEVAVDKGLIKLNKLLYQRYKALIDQISYKAFKQKYSGEPLKAKVEGKTYIILGSEVIKFLELDNNELDYLLSKPNQKDCIPKEAFLYMIRKFIIRENIKDNFILPEQIEERMNEIINYEILDFEAINTYLSD